ncbi:hypothetical protein JL49_24965, partial [Pseudoalteromonas luteoviolacea]
NEIGITVKDTDTEQAHIKRYIGNDAIQKYYSTGISSLNWLFTDHQGSVITVTDNKLRLIQRFEYDVWGKKSTVGRDNDLYSEHYVSDHLSGLFGTIPRNLRSYTGHEPVALGDDNRILHMNGRVYDVDTGRVMQADPFVQAPMNLQNYNAYSYVLNNPLSYTDPSGYLFKKLAGTLLGRKGAQLAGYGLGGITGAWLGGRTYDRIMGSEGLQTAVAVALNFVPGCQVWCSALFSAQVNYYHTGSVGSALRAGATSAATAYAFSAIGDYYKGEYGSFAGAEFGEQLQWAGSHALVGGVSSVASGGKFGHGFVSAGFTKMAMGNAGFNMNNRDWDAIVGRTTVAAIVGGTASALVGGKFANGARTAAMMHALNGEMRSYFQRLHDEYKLINNTPGKGYAIADNAGGKVSQNFALRHSSDKATRENWENTCAIKASHIENQVGENPIGHPNDYGSNIRVLTSNNGNYIYGAKDFANRLTELHGSGVSVSPGYQNIQGKTGWIYYDNYHVDLWDGNGMVGNAGYSFSSNYTSRKMTFWEIK